MYIEALISIVACTSIQCFKIIKCISVNKQLSDEFVIKEKQLKIVHTNNKKLWKK